VTGSFTLCIVSPFSCCGSNHLVSNPERITSALLYGFEPEGNGGVSGRAHTVEDGRDLVASIGARDNQEAHLIDEIGLEEGPVNVAASLEKQSADSEVLSEPVHGISEVDRRISGDDVGDSLLPEHGQVALWDLSLTTQMR
jgi:hypothetical protein